MTDLDQTASAVSANGHREPVIVTQPSIDRVPQCRECIISRDTVPKRAGSYDQLHKNRISCIAMSRNDVGAGIKQSTESAARP